jgi:hypothetical protein
MNIHFRFVISKKLNARGAVPVQPCNQTHRQIEWL